MYAYWSKYGAHAQNAYTRLFAVLLLCCAMLLTKMKNDLKKIILTAAPHLFSATPQPAVRLCVVRAPKLMLWRQLRRLLVCLIFNWSSSHMPLLLRLLLCWCNALQCCMQHKVLRMKKFHMPHSSPSESPHSFHVYVFVCVCMGIYCCRLVLLFFIVPSVLSFTVDMVSLIAICLSVGGTDTYTSMWHVVKCHIVKYGLLVTYCLLSVICIWFFIWSPFAVDRERSSLPAALTSCVLFVAEFEIF